ncbi:MAG: type II toxin-antitoxin system HipA family toxin [Candidatus Melainabacteria bacterium]|nr:MAG: type II toxin-antitoxin system HipA family toxin [Candidatus Melainabacteria bacterium]
MTSTAWVKLWGTTIGAVTLDEPGGIANFQYDPAFVGSDIQVSPLQMPLSNQVFSFATLRKESFHGLPGMLADSLPDKFGNRVIDAWLANQGRLPESFDAVERLRYTGSRGMGALEYAPPEVSLDKSTVVDIPELVELANRVLQERVDFNTKFEKFGHDKSDALNDIVKVSSSAGGARAKALIAWNEATGEIRSGQTIAPEGFSYWLLKFDGVSNNKDKELADPQGYGIVEYAYNLMAVAAGIEMTECRLLKENGRNHFVTRRFDRLNDGSKLHMQSLCGLAHFDFNSAGVYSYEEAMNVMRHLELGLDAVEQQFRRMIFNVVSRNHDDHTKNIAFLMDRRGKWSLAPAFDMTYSWNKDGDWTNQHQMSINGKRDNFVLEDFVECGRKALLKSGRVKSIINDVQKSVSDWSDFATKAGLSEKQAAQYKLGHRQIIV